LKYNKQEYVSGKNNKYYIGIIKGIDNLKKVNRKENTYYLL